jgi:hypothetical protein
MMTTTDMTGGKPIALRLQFISGVSAANHLVALYNINGRKGEVIFFCSIPDTIRNYILLYHHHQPIDVRTIEHRPSLWITHKENGP